VASAHLTMRAEQHGRVCVLAVTGDLDLVTAAEFTREVTAALEGDAERLVLDLSAMRFLDCCGARALAAVSGGSSVVVRSLRPAARRVLDVIGMDVRHPGGSAGHGRTARLVRHSQTARMWSQHVLAQSCMVAEQIAATEENVAVTLARLAQRRPASADRLLALSEAVHTNAAGIRVRAREGLRHVA